MLETLKKAVYEANMDLQRYGLITFTWGNASGIDRERGLFVIKPSGVAYEKLTPDMMVVVDLQGNTVEGASNPSSDMKTHLVLYNSFDKIGGVVHTHSTWATSWAQSGRNIPCYGTTHADYFYGAIPCLRNLTEQEIDEDYEYNTGVLIAEYFARMKGRTHAELACEHYLSMPGVLCKNHGPFTWGTSPAQAVYHAVVLERIAEMAARSEMLNSQISEAPDVLQDKHYLRKHGLHAYYGQKKTEV